jgi:glycosyltransferase involved in cell wall biosynthesis
MNTTPPISVVMPAYNHADFIEESILSVLNQEFSDLELLVGDDGSSDDTVARARKIKDHRVQVFQNPVNRGAALSLSELIGRARGKYVAIINSDDAWLPGKLEKQFQFLENNPEIGACFGRARFFDRSGKDIPKAHLPFGSVFDAENRSRGAWLRHFFLRGNCICHPTILIRRDLYKKLGAYDNRLRQLPDFEMWIRLVKISTFHIFDEDFIRFRVLPGENASANTQSNTTRILNEHHFIAEGFFDALSPELLQEGFSDLLIHSTIASPEHLDIEKAFLFFQPVRSLMPSYRLIGLSKLHDFLTSERHRLVLERDYSFDDRAFHKLASEVTTFTDSPWKERRTLKKILSRLKARTKRLISVLSAR